MPGFTNYLRNKVLDHVFRGEDYTPPASVWIKLVSSQPSAAVAGTALAGGGTTRIEIPCTLADFCGTQGATTTTASSGTSGQISNNAIVDFGTAESDWGDASHWEAYDDETAGNRLIFGTITNAAGTASPRSIAAGDPVTFPISALRITAA